MINSRVLAAIDRLIEEMDSHEAEEPMEGMDEMGEMPVHGMEDEGVHDLDDLQGPVAHTLEITKVEPGDMDSDKEPLSPEEEEMLTKLMARKQK